MTLSENIQEISREGFQVVSGDLFQRPLRLSAPTATIWPSSICFSKAALIALNNCERIRIEINPSTRCMLVIPVTEKDKDSVKWTKNVKDPNTRKIECTAFTRKLYETWGWNDTLAYRTTGRVVSSEKKVMLMFDFNTTDSWKFKGKAKAI